MSSVFWIKKLFVLSLAPLSTVLLVITMDSDCSSYQSLMFFMCGKAASGAPNIKGTNQFPNPPIRISLSMKKVIKKVWPLIDQVICD